MKMRERGYLQNIEQCNILSNLNQEIKNLQPLRCAYQRLYDYYLHLSQEFQKFSIQNNYCNNALTNQVKDLQSICLQVENSRNLFVSDLKCDENKREKVMLDHKKLRNQCQSVQYGIELDLIKKKNLHEKSKQLEKDHIKLKNMIQNARNVLNELKIKVKQKNDEKNQFDKKCNFQKDQNKKLSQINQKKQLEIQYIQKQRKIYLQNKKQIGNQIQQYENNINKLLKQCYLLKQKLIKDQRNFQNIIDEKEYKYKLLKNQQNTKQEFIYAQNKLQKYIKSIQQENLFKKKQNQLLSENILEQKKKNIEKKNYIKYTIQHMNNLIENNMNMVKKMEECCNQDSKISEIFKLKINKLIKKSNQAKNCQLHAEYKIPIIQKYIYPLNQLDYNRIPYNYKHQQLQDDKNSTGLTWHAQNIIHNNKY